MTDPDCPSQNRSETESVSLLHTICGIQEVPAPGAGRKTSIILGPSPLTMLLFGPLVIAIAIALLGPILSVVREWIRWLAERF